MTVRQYRERIGLTRAQLAGRLGVSVSTVKRWEHGYRPRKRGQLEALARGLRLSRSESESLVASFGP